MSAPKATILVLASVASLLDLGLATAATDAVATALRKNDECSTAGDSAEHCALNAIQTRGRIVTVSAQPDDNDDGGKPSNWKSWSDVSSSIEGSIGEANWDKLKDYAKGHEQGITCHSWTGGSCFTGGCSASRGGAECHHWMCMCPEGMCAYGGKCTTQHKTCEGVAGGELRESAWRDMGTVCKCAKDQTIQGESPECDKVKGKRYYGLGLTDGACRCTGGAGFPPPTGTPTDPSQVRTATDAGGAGSPPPTSTPPSWYAGFTPPTGTPPAWYAGLTLPTGTPPAWYR